MKKLFLILLISGSLFALKDMSDIEKEKKARIEKQIKIEMEKEKKYAKEQTFYNHYNYDYKGAEVNLDSLDNIPDFEIDELDMDSVYD